VTNPSREVTPEKNPATVALGRLGRLKGDRVRAARLRASKRSAIAQKSAKSR
jgi:hypothetical protein